MTGREDFGPTLRRERERRGIGLDQIAEKTKISASLFAAMERNDFSRWPNGIFRRSFLRAYAEVVGLDADALVRQFLQLYPSPDYEVALTPPSSAPSPSSKREHREHHREPHVHETAKSKSSVHASARVAATLADMGLVALLASVGWLLGGWFGVGPAAALAGTLIFVVGNVLLGKTPGSWLIGPRRAPALAVASRPQAAAKRAVDDERVATKRRSTRESHQTVRRHTVRRLDRSRSRRA